MEHSFEVGHTVTAFNTRESKRQTSTILAIYPGEFHGQKVDFADVQFSDKEKTVRNGVLVGLLRPFKKEAEKKTKAGVT